MCNVLYISCFQVDYLKFIAVNMVTSHPHYDKEGNTYNIGTSIAERGKTKYTLFKVPAASETGGPDTNIIKVIVTYSTYIQGLSIV